ncbi:Mobile element protein [Mesorhizobium prunaredense]|uniref:Mobile element protein n=1 Tax=Mesorhizobium prunaredense TaxID=1631249 RepID=A0A1R3VFV4_9HYPH|nr:Mobile element protein [Mesorhizobium prunaredense]
MARLRGRAPRGERCRAAVPHGHWKSTTFTAGLRLNGIAAPWLLDGAMDGEAFLVYLRRVLAPTLQPGDVIVMDNLPAHKVAGAARSIPELWDAVRLAIDRFEPKECKRHRQPSCPWGVSGSKRAQSQAICFRCHCSSKVISERNAVSL